MEREIARTENTVIAENEKGRYIVYLIDFGTKTFANKHEAFSYAREELPKMKDTEYWKESHIYGYGDPGQYWG